MTTTEDQLRRRLGIPPGARRVLVFGESSHWDPNWLFTSDEYYGLRIRRLLDRVLDELEGEPRRVFGVECIFFLDLYWRRQPEQRQRLLDAIERGQLRLLGSGLTTPDTLLPETESILRDYLLGQQWLRDRGLSVEPRTAYLPDDFGHSPELPALLAALGFDRTAISRIDGMHFVGADYRPASRFPLPGSSAERLLRQHRSLDFVWQAADGSEVLAHWNAFTYFQGDMLASKGVIRWMGLTLGIPWRSAGHVARRIDGFVAQLEPLARTPYLFCPIGCDFNDPIRDLVALLDRYNQQRFGDSGTWVVNAGLDDYLELVDCHRRRLPRLRLDPNPYWMGFYATRPAIKQLLNRTAHKLLATERRLCRPQPPPASAQPELARAWELVAVANHHDFITGTSPDRVYFAEQQPMLERAERMADRLWAGVRPAPAAAAAGALPDWQRRHDRIHIRSPHYRAVLSEAAGGCLVSLEDADGRELLAGPSNDALSYRDAGGLWRLGHEYAGGRFTQRARTSQRQARIELIPEPGALRARIATRLEYEPLLRELWFSADSPIIRLRLFGRAPRRRTLTVRFASRLNDARLWMDVAGGLAERPARKLYDPTFWPARTFAHLQGADRGLALIMGGPAAVSADGAGGLETMALRNAPRELAFGLLPVLGHPASGHDDAEHAYDYALVATAAGDPAALGLPFTARRALDRLPGWAGEQGAAAVTVDRADVMASAIKPAYDGRGLIVRLTRFGPPGEAVVECPDQPLRAAWLCDARERDLERLASDGTRVRLRLRRTLTSLRLETATGRRSTPLPTAAPEG
jgi:hypothetical protein